jgi:hypothetical protein
MASEVTGDSPQAVAYKLAEAIAMLENKPFSDRTKGADRQYVLELYKQCIHTVLDIRKWGPYGS